MAIDGVSQSSGAERLVDVAAEPKGGLLLVIRDRASGAERGKVVAPADAVMSVLTNRPVGPQAIVGLVAGRAKLLGMEVRKNEVLLTVGPADAAVGLDDLMDALAGALPA